ncbi:MAG: hypothetical protein K9M57_02185 [Phycisphaerae bacterium]|nr:hypothetical protein [Phycisphaerae bacterium]
MKDAQTTLPAEDKLIASLLSDAHNEETEEEVFKDQKRGKKSDRRTGMDRRCGHQSYDGPERRKPQEGDWDRRRGPGRRRSDDRKSAEEGEMNDDQFELIKAIGEYKRINKRAFPSYTEILEIVKALGYRKVAEPKPLNTTKVPPTS